MKITNCFWELQNLGESVAEISIEHEDFFDASKIENVNKEFQYVVVKVPMNKVNFNEGLAKMGFFMIETQIYISKRFNHFNFSDPLIKQIYDHVRLEEVNTQEGMDEILSQITPDMFSTDRIYLDSYFPHEASSRRYINWIRTEFQREDSALAKYFYDEKNVGFTLIRQKGNGIIQGFLGGIYEKYQDRGLGMITASLKFIAAKKEGKPFKILHTAISSNNIPMLQFYNYLGFKVDGMNYVFVKHNKV